MGCLTVMGYIGSAIIKSKDSNNIELPLFCAALMLFDIFKVLL